MKHRIALTGLMIALASSAAHAQYIENFATPKLGPAWSFILPGQNPGYPAGLGNTEDVTHYSISNNTFTVTQQGGGITYGHNIPTVTIGSGATGNYDIRLTVNAPFNYPGQTVYPSAGLLIATDASNYLTFGTKSAGGNNNYPNVYLASAGSPVGGQYDNLTSYQNVGAGPVVYHINKTGTTISFSYIAVGSTTEAPLGTVTAADTDTFKAAAYALLSNLGGKHIGPYSDNFSNTITDTVSFSSFSTSLPVVLPKTTDNFFGPKLNPTWSFFLPGGWQGQGGSDEDASAYKVANGVFAVQATNGGLYGPGNYIRNLPLATVQANAPGDYVIETAVDATFNYPNVAEVYPDWGILVGDDTSNYFFIGTKHSGYTNNNTTAPANYNYPNTYLKIGNNNIGNYDNFQDYSGTGIGPILYRIRKVGTTITFSATRAGDVEKIMGTASASDDPTSYAGQVYTYLKNVSGKRIILAANPGFNSAINDTVAFSRFYTSLPLVQPLQFADELSGSALSGAWSFNVTGNNPVNTEDPTAYNVANGAFNVTLKGNNFPNAVNVPSVTVGTGNASDWWIETAVKVSFDAVNGYPIAMLTVFDDANNFFEYGIKHNSYNGANYNDATSLLSIGGTFTDDLLTDYAGVGTSDNAVFRIVKSAGTITLSFLDANNNEHVTGTLDSSATGAKKDAYTLLSNINGKHIGFCHQPERIGCHRYGFLRLSPQQPEHPAACRYDGPHCAGRRYEPVERSRRSRDWHVPYRVPHTGNDDCHQVLRCHPDTGRNHRFRNLLDSQRAVRHV